MIPLLVVRDPNVLPPRAETLGADVRQMAALPDGTEVDDARPTAILLAPEWRDAPVEALRALAARSALVVCGAPGETAPPNGVAGDVAVGWLPAGADAATRMSTLRAALRHAEAVWAAHARFDELTELTRIGVALSTERDLKTLLALILSQARRLVAADAGSLYLVDRGQATHSAATVTGPRTMRFTLAQNHTLPDLPFRESTVEINSRSLAGYVAVSGRPLVVDDVYAIGADVPYHFNRSFDEQVGYRTRSVLVIPMRSHRDEIVGVLQLINRKRDADVSLHSVEDVDRWVIPFDDHTVTLASALASQAAVAIENNKLYEDIERLFEGFVTAAVHTIEQRDPTTSGHSSRVTAYTMGLADALNRGLGHGAYAETRFSRLELRELRYACLLHDFGKVAVREAVLQKEKKLYGSDLAAIRHRFVFLLQSLDLESERSRVEYLLVNGREGFEEASARVEDRRRERRAELQQMLDAILRANEPTILAEAECEELRTIADRSYTDHLGEMQRLLSERELQYLSIRRGNLNDRERKEIESHASQSYAFLARIPWTRELRGIPEIVWGHHEKLNGRGYPRGITAEMLQLQTRMMTIADIFDALTASDRPYKKAVTPARAIEILQQEVDEGALDPDLFRTFVDAKIWEAVADEVRRKTREARLTGATPQFLDTVRVEY